MKLGICTKIENAAAAAAAGFDYLEYNLSSVAAKSEEDFELLRRQTDSSPIPALKSNGFMPGEVKVTGQDASAAAQREYLEKALSRAAALGIRLAVFGSGGARNVPEGWSYKTAWQQVADFLKLCGEYCEKYGITLAIEPLRRSECNIINLVSEAAILASLSGSPRITVLGDSFHMLSSHEPWDALVKAGPLLTHFHISHPLEDLSKRYYPATGDGTDYAPIFEALKSAGYTGDISVEASSRVFAEDAVNAVKCLRSYMN